MSAEHGRHGHDGHDHHDHDHGHDHSHAGKHGHGHNHGHAHGHAGHDHMAGANERSLRIAFVLTAAFLLVELAGGLVTRSLALISDAAHMFTDVAALAIALMAIRIARRPADAKRSFGYHRFEIIAAAFNALLLFAAAVYILYEAWLRLQAPPQIQSTGMLVIAVIGLGVNLASMLVLRSGQDSSLNVKGAYLEVWADAVGSVGVIIGALLIKLTGLGWIDTAVALLIGLWVVPRTWSLLKSSVHILLEGTPEGLDLAHLRSRLLAVPGVLSLHDLHVWSVTSGKASLTVHLVTRPDVNSERDVLPAVRRLLAREFDLHHTTVQCEHEPCGQAHEDHAEHFKPGAAGG
jgi:cobalt-zinc-cadmium efflux system protein